MQTFDEVLRKHFPEAGNPRAFVDALIWRITGKMTLDVIKFSDWFEAEHGIGEDESLRDAIDRVKGEGIGALVGELI